MPFKPMQNYVPATEIDGCISSHPPMEYKVVEWRKKFKQYYHQSSLCMNINCQMVNSLSIFFKNLIKFPYYLPGL